LTVFDIYSIGGATYTQVQLIHKCNLYTSATYTQVRLIHKCDLYTGATYTQVYRVLFFSTCYTEDTYAYVKCILWGNVFILTITSYTM